MKIDGLPGEWELANGPLSDFRMDCMEEVRVIRRIPEIANSQSKLEKAVMLAIEIYKDQRIMEDHPDYMSHGIQISRHLRGDEILAEVLKKMQE